MIVIWLSMKLPTFLCNAKKLPWSQQSSATGCCLTPNVMKSTASCTLKLPMWPCPFTFFSYRYYAFIVLPMRTVRLAHLVLISSPQKGKWIHILCWHYLSIAFLLNCTDYSWHQQMHAVVVKCSNSPPLHGSHYTSYRDKSIRDRR